MRLYCSAGEALLVGRSAESDTHPLFWGTAAQRPSGGGSVDKNDDNMSAEDGDVGPHTTPHFSAHPRPVFVSETQTQPNFIPQNTAYCELTSVELNSVRRCGEEWDGTVLFSSDLAAIDGPCGGAAVAFPLGKEPPRM